MDTDELQLPPGILNSRQSRALSLWEEHLEKKIDRDRLKPRSKLQRLRKQGQEILHSRLLLLTVVVLNCLDCLLVLSELVLDVYFIKEMIVTAENTMETFNQLLKDRHPEQFAGFHVHDTHKFYNKILKTKLICDSNWTIVQVDPTLYRTARSVMNATADTDADDHGLPVFKESDDPHFLEEEVHSMEEMVSHAFHKTSITILGILVLFTLFKIFCHGLSFVKHKLEVFDSIVVIASFSLDVCYINGLTNYPVESFVLILVIMIPWRIIRVLNSLIIAVKDNFHFLLKMMYRKNKYQREKIQQLETLRAQQQNILDALTEMCNINGVTDQQMLETLASPTKRKQTKPFSFGACLSRQVSFEPEQMTRVWESVPCLPERGSFPGQLERDKEDNIQSIEGEKAPLPLS